MACSSDFLKEINSAAKSPLNPIIGVTCNWSKETGTVTISKLPFQISTWLNVFNAAVYFGSIFLKLWHQQMGNGISGSESNTITGLFLALTAFCSLACFTHSLFKNRDEMEFFLNGLIQLQFKHEKKHRGFPSKRKFPVGNVALMTVKLNRLGSTVALLAISLASTLVPQFPLNLVNQFPYNFLLYPVLGKR